MTKTETPIDGGGPRRVGHVGLAGAPNAGKSTLINRLVGQKISIVSQRPQTTREAVRGIVTNPAMQAILLDIPGITAPRDRLGGALLGWVNAALRQCDLILHLRSAQNPHSPDDAGVIDAIRAARKPVWLVWNKTDMRPPPTVPEPSPLKYQRVLKISALRGTGIDELLAALADALPFGPLLYDPEQLSDRDLRFMVAELVREQMFRRLGQEIPYGTAALTEEFDENREGKAFISVQIVAEREAHKPIIIGKGGSMLKAIGQGARAQIEELLGREVFLELRVKVKAKWRSDEAQLARMGLLPPDSR